VVQCRLSHCKIHPFFNCFNLFGHDTRQWKVIALCVWGTSVSE